MDRSDLNFFKDELLKHQKDLVRLMEISEESRAPVELDQTTQGRLSRQDALIQQEMAKETGRRRQIDMTRIEAALKRIESEDFGYCASCDEEIPKERLRLDPAIAICINCAK